MQLKKILLTFSALLPSVVSTVTRVPSKDYKPDIFVLTDISNEPDDAESLVRLLLYTNDVTLKGLVATTSQWLNYTIKDHDLYPIIKAYEKVHPNLLQHSSDYPSANYIRDLIKLGKPVFGTDALGGALSGGAKSLIDAIDGTEDTIYVLLWGGANVLAEALEYVRSKRSKSQTASFVSKVFVYAISDQDNSGIWIRRNFPKLRYIVSLHAYNQYEKAAWVGISGEKFYKFDKGGPDSSLISHEWLYENVQSVGALGKVYPDYSFIMEGDTPSLLYTIPNGLNWPSDPTYGGWGGRYKLVDRSANHLTYSDTSDFAIGLDGETHFSSQAGIWRWRPAFQNDFKVRMQWTVKDFKSSVHQPIVVANGTTSVKPTYLKGVVNDTIILDVSESYDLNNSELSYKFFHYREPTATTWNPGDNDYIEIIPLNEEKSVVKLTLPVYKLKWFDLHEPTIKVLTHHIIAEVTNKAGAVAYHRYVINVYQKPEFLEEVISKSSVNTHDEL